MSDIIALCGVDGSGKSSLLQALREEFSPSDLACVPSAEKTNATLVERRAAIHRRYGDSRDWITGPFARLVATASCLDFLRHYEARIQPLIGTTPLIVCDRYSPCFMAYARLANVQPEFVQILATVQAPTLVLYIDAKLELLPERYIKRGGATQLETTLFAERFRQSYEQIFETLPIEVIRIDNSGPFHVTVATAAAHLRNILVRSRTARVKVRT